MSKGVATLLGHRAEDLIDRPLHNLGSHIHPEDAFPLRASLDRARTGKQDWQFAFRVLLPGKALNISLVEPHQLSSTVSFISMDSLFQTTAEGEEARAKAQLQAAQAQSQAARVQSQVEKS